MCKCDEKSAGDNAAPLMAEKTMTQKRTINKDDSMAKLMVVPDAAP